MSRIFLFVSEFLGDRLSSLSDEMLARLKVVFFENIRLTLASLGKFAFLFYRFSELCR